jgi:hypothetical protein
VALVISSKGMYFDFWNLPLLSEIRFSEVVAGFDYHAGCSYHELHLRLLVYCLILGEASIRGEDRAALPPTSPPQDPLSNPPPNILYLLSCAYFFFPFSSDKSFTEYVNLLPDMPMVGHTCKRHKETTRPCPKVALVSLPYLFFSPDPSIISRSSLTFPNLFFFKVFPKGFDDFIRGDNILP